MADTELSMNQGELMEAAYASLDISIGMSDTFYTILFAYIVAMYLAGAKLERPLYVIANVMYLLVMATTITGIHQTWFGFEGWMEDAWGPRLFLDAVRVWANTGVSALLVVLSMWFGFKVRNSARA